MSFLNNLSDPACWEAFYAYRTSLACPKADADELRRYIDEKAYLPVTEMIRKGGRFPLPRRAVISKMHAQKKRVVYIYPPAENTVLKLLTWLLLRRCDGLFEDNLYSFRPGRTAKDAVRALRAVPGLGEMWAYKADVSNYFNSIPVEKLLPMLAEALGEDGRLYGFLSALLGEERALSGRETVREQKGIMAGTPLSAFYANLYLRELDRHFARRGVPYARYSDDIILFAPDRAGAEALAGEVRAILTEHGLGLNPAKEELFDPAEGWTFLGFRCRGDTVDIAPASLEKIKGKMRRKSRALMRWRQRGGYGGEKAAAAFIRVFNRKLLESPPDNDLSWSRWFFPLLTTADSLRDIDRYAQDCLRWLVSGKRTKGRYDVRYEDLKRLGYRSLVHEYYAFQKEEN